MNTNTRNNVNTGNNKTSSYTALVHIGGIGFIFEVNKSPKQNLISPDVLALFDGVQESEEVTEDCAFPLPKSNTNSFQYIFQPIGDNWAVCSDGIFRKCQRVKCRIEYNSNTLSVVFHIDRRLIDKNITGIISI